MARTYATSEAVIIISTIFPAMGIVVVFLRFYTRIKLGSMLWIDDWLTIPALFFELVLAALLIWGGATKSLGDLLPPPSVPGPDGYLFSTSPRQIRLQQIQYFADIAAILAFGFTKLSILFFYRKIFCSAGISKTVFDVITWVVIVLVVAWTTAFGFGAIFLCGVHPTNAWAPVAVVSEKCSAQLKLLEGYAISDFIMDVIIWLLPIPKILALNMSLRKRIAVVGVFLVGLIATAASATRMGIYITYIVNAFAQSDGETLITYLMFWTMIECGLGVVVVCLPTLRPLQRIISMDSIVSQIRGKLSLKSLPRRSSQDSGSIGLYNFGQSVNSTSTQSKAHYNTYSGSGNAYSAEAIRSARASDWSKPGIHVKHEIEQY
ncbi:uncharacterized protein ATNIH1004_008657 [Aspergillus tanneri]|uniref:Rhodopsin domain-containing protein n=1 Tax=Aspergillus tanneri TaxID=1220188 RepID=A0A5M9MHG9_9EURO|nr:uncharacterized protein ATNIH1004_008657 [Aspergillus tanneri]KAA8644453.1 hypothetical protein ATNIH1004_008657 [Aspergillus tanneri]